MPPPPSRKSRNGSSGKPEESKAIEFLEKFVSTLRMVQRYSLNSPLAKDSLWNLYSDLVELIPFDGELSFSELYNHLTINEIPLLISNQTHPFVGSFLFFMLERNLQRIVFKGNCSEKDLGQFLGFLADWPPMAQVDPMAEIKARGIAGIAVEQKDESEAALADLRDRQPTSVPVSPAKAKTAEKAPAKAGPAEKNAPQHIKEGMAPVAEGPAKPSRAAAEDRDKTEIRSRPKETGVTTYSKGIGPEKVVLPEGTVHLVVIAKLGRMILDGAEVTVLSDPAQKKTTEAQYGAGFILKPGLQKIRVAYDRYQVEVNVDLDPEDHDVQVDINLLESQPR